jgi:competence protein ComEC
MTDAGPDSKIVNSLEKSISHSRKLIDVAIISHPEIDHFNGFNYVLDHYRVGVFVINGRDRPPEIRQWAELMKKIKDQNIPLVTLGEGDSIRYGSNRIDFISPGPQFVASAELNDGALVEKIQTPDFRALFMADAGINVEEYLRGRYDLHADILKVGHHGSKYSSGIEFIRAVQPALAVIEVSARNTYGHPSAITLSRLSASTIPVLRTDKNGTITVWRVAGKIKVSTEN